MTSRYKAYPEYKKTGVEWIPDLPANWIIERTKRMFSLKRSLVGNRSSNYQLLSLTLRGVIPRDISSGEGKIPESFDTYQEVDKDDLVFCLFDIDETPRTIGISPLNGMITGAYNVYGCLDTCHSVYAYYYFFHIDSFKGLKPFYTGLRKVVRAETFSNIEMPCPSYKEQQKIANFLVHETGKIDTLIAKQEKLIELLKEKLQAVISHTVTKGLNPDAPMKKSGVEWLGEVPEHWIIGRLKNVLKIRNGKDYKHVEVESGGYPVYGSGGIFKRSHQYLYDGISVLFGRKGTIDKPLIVRGKFWTVDTMFYSELHQNTNAEYIHAQATLFPFSLLSTNTALPSMTQEDLLGLGFVIPPLEEQLSIAETILEKNSKFDVLINKTKNQISLMNERKTALISATVTGKIDVRDWKGAC